MRKTKLIIPLLIILLILQLVQFTGIQAQTNMFEVLSVMWGSYSAPTEVGPGDIGTLTVILRIKNSISSQTIVARLELPRGFTSVNGEPSITAYLRYGSTSIPAGTVLEFQFKVKVGDNIALGRYTAKMVLEYIVEALYYSRTYSDEVYVVIPLYGRPNISLHNYNTSTYPGQQLIVLGLANDGTATANKVKLEVSVQPSIYSNTSEVRLDSLAPKDVVAIPIEVFIPPSLTNSTVTLTSSLTYYGPSGTQYSSTFKSTIYVNRYDKPILNVFLDSNEILSGSQLIANLKLSNYGGIARDLVIRLSAQQPLQVCSTSLYVVNSLGSGASTSLPVGLCSLQTSSNTLSMLTVTVDYSDDYGVSSSKTFNIPVVLRALRESLISVDLIDRELPGGVETRLRLNLSNVGSINLRNISVQSVFPQNFILLTSPQLRVEVLPPSSAVCVEFLVKTPHVDSATYVRVGFQVNYVDDLGNYFSNVYDFTAVIKPQELRKVLMLDIEPRRFNALSTGLLKLTLISTEDVRNVQISIAGEGLPLMLNTSKDVLVGRLEANERYVTYIPYAVANRPGTYLLVINVKYLDPLSVLKTDTNTYLVEVIPIKALLDISLTPSHILSGSTTTLTVRIRNSGDSLVKDLTLTVNPQGTLLTLVNTSKHFIGDIRPGESKYVDISLKASSVTAYTVALLSLTATYYDILNQVYSESYTSAVSVEPRTPVGALDITLNVNELSIATVNNVTVRLSNRGSDVIDGISYRITTGSGLSIIGANDGYIPKLNPGESITLHLPIYVSLTSIYTSNLVMSFTYVDKALGSLRSEDKVFTLLLRGKADLRVIDYVVIPTTVNVGQTFSVSLTLINVGVIPTYSTFVSPVIAGLPIRSLTEERAIYLGNIDVGSTTAATITLQLMNTSERIIRLPVVISYLDNLRTPKNVTTELIIRVGTPANITQTVSPSILAGGSNVPYTTILLIVIAVAIVGVVIWKFMRR